MSSGCRPYSWAERRPHGVASIKLNTDPEAPLAFQVEPNGTLSTTAITPKRLMMTAYVQGFRIVGGPAWVNRGHATPVIESDAMAKKTKNAPKGKSRSQKLSVKKQPIKAAAPKQGKDVKGEAFLRIRRFD